MKFNDPAGNEENVVGGGTVVNESGQDIYFAFDAEDLTGKSPGEDMILVLPDKQSSTDFTPDADAVLIAPGQSINGETSGVFKISIGAVTIKKDKNGKLVLEGSLSYEAMKKRSDPADRSGYQSAQETPPQWRLQNKSKEGMKDDQRRMKETKEARKTHFINRKIQERWQKVKSWFHR